MALEAARLEQPTPRQLVLGVLEDAPEGALVRRLCRFAQRLKPRHVRLDLLLRQRRQQELRPRDHLAVAQLRVPVAQPELVRREPPGPVGVYDQRALEDRGPVAPVGPGVHPDAAADRAGDRTRELEAAET